ncbi:CDP-diacylglycerol--glycerol-3-phosphate 3-phosphatidyltransferase [Homalodisca vitripennis]|nr:CDP-diacylglycerol--glycerol-3-phosphate 3-phosphatidyltransferase [Homalodisca vitripennis]
MNCDNNFSLSNLEWLQKESPGFSLSGNQIKVLFTPEEFYNALLDGCRGATNRIMMAALYIGMDSLEHKLVEVLDERLTERGKDLQVSVLLDAVRSSRDRSAQLTLLPLVQKHPHCQVSLYHTPELRGLWLRLLPLKVNEAIGIQHIKIYMFDDDVIISGANLTKDYFTNRQDRYMLMSGCRALADFCAGLITRLCSVSLRLSDEGELVPRLPHLHPTLAPPGQYEKHARDIVWGYYQHALRKSSAQLKPGDDTWVFPLLQLPPLMVLQDSSVTQSILESVDPHTTIQLASPYFNLPENYISSFVHKCRSTFNILIPHPTANDFFGARGFAGQIPWLYSALTGQFLHTVRSTGQDKRFCVAEYTRPSSSYHCKGVWLTAQDEESPYLTIVGSSNFNHRSVKRDLECQMVVVTNNPSLRCSLREETQRLYRHGVMFTQDVALRPDRKPKLWHNVFLWLFKGYF